MADELRMLIGGKWVSSLGGGTFDAISPSTGEVIGGGRFSMVRLTEWKTVVVNMGPGS